MKASLTVYRYFLCILFLLSFMTFPAIQLYAQDVLNDTLLQETKTKGKPNSLVQKLTDRIDRFFSDEHIEEELQTSSIRIKPGVQWSEKGDLELLFPTRLNLVLPRLQNRWQIFFSSIPDDDNDQDPNSDDYTDNQPSLEEEKKTSSLLGIQFAPIADLEQHLKFITGIKIRTDEFNPFALTRFRYKYPLGLWSFRFIQTAFFYADNGFGETSQIDFSRPLGEETFFRARSSATWSEQTRGVGLKQSFFLRYFVSETKVLGIYWRIGGHTSPETVVDGHTLALEFRTKVWFDWLFWEISPQAFYHRNNNFNFEPVLISSFEIIF